VDKFGYGGYGGGGGFGGGGGAYGANGGFGGGGGRGGGDGGFGGGNAGGAFGGGGGGAGLGGAIFNMGDSTVAGSGVLIITNSTLTGNTAQGGSGSLTGNGGSGYGAAIFNLDGSVTLNDDTLAANTVTGGSHGVGGSTGQADGGAVYNLAFGNVLQTGAATSATLVLYNSILSNTIGGGYDLASNAINGKNTNTAAITGSTNMVLTKNLSTNTSLAAGVITITGSGLNWFRLNPRLGPLQNNGGLTPTMALPSNSAAYGAGNPNVPGLPGTDQRGLPRTVNGRLDLGAFQVQNVTASSPPVLQSGTPSSEEPPSNLSTFTSLPTGGELMQLAVDEVLLTIDSLVALAETSVGIAVDPALAAAMAADSNAINANPEDHTPLGDAVTASSFLTTMSLLRTDLSSMTSTRSA
jgi:hypothetical protein